MGLLSAESWSGAQWLADPAMLHAEEQRTSAPNEIANSTVRLRREFLVKPNLKRALIHVCGVGQADVTVNGRPATDALLTPAWSFYSKTRYVETLDVTRLLASGANAIGIELAGGFYNVAEGKYTKLVTPFHAVSAIAQIRLEYSDGRVEIVVTDRSWRERHGPVTFCNIYGGEEYDARLEEPGWNSAHFDDASWKAPAVCLPYEGRLVGAAEGSPPFRSKGDLKPVSIHDLGAAQSVYDLGQNVSLMIRLRVRGPRGSTVKVIPAEILRKDGHVDRSSVGGGESGWSYTLSGNPHGEVWRPTGFYHGSRYLEVHCAPSPTAGELPSVSELVGVIVHSDSAPAGKFECSNRLLNRIETLIRWAQLSNLAHVITDCPHRERLGWLEQYHLNGPALRYEWTLDRLFSKTLVDMQDSQLDSGLVPDIAPEYTEFQGGFRDSPEWGSAYVIVPWDEYLWTASVEPLRKHFEGMKRYVDFLQSTATGNIVDHGLGDWYDLGPAPLGYAQLTPVALTATAFYFRDAEIVANAARLLGREEDARHYADLAAEIRVAFNQRFFDAAKGTYGERSQTANAIPLVMGLVGPEHREAVLASLIKDVESRGFSVTAGDVGHRYLLRALADNGRSDVVYRIHSQTDRPGYGYILSRGATSLTEGWDGSSSQNHFMLGHITEWFFSDVLGIRLDPQSAGFKRTIIKPTIVGDLTWAKGSYESVHGQISVSWRVDGSRFRLDVTIPANTTAEIHLPIHGAKSVTESGHPASSAPNVEQVGGSVYLVGSGTYHFMSYIR